MTDGKKLLVFTRYPEPGKTKTRLIPLLGEQGASDLHSHLTVATIDQIEPLANSQWSLEICFTGGSQKLMQDWLGDRFNYREQRGDGLGDRMKLAFTDAFAAGVSQVAIIGTDCPDLTASIITEAFTALGDRDLVLGPAEDGGYYLIGLKQVWVELFTGIAWGTDTVLAQTLAIAEKLALRTYLLPVLQDIDRPEDLDSLGNFPLPPHQIIGTPY
jgi:hypothetical protein